MMDEATYQARLTEYMTLPPGWNSYDAAALSHDAIATARRFSPDNTSGIVFWPVPIADGRIQIEAHQDGYDLEIEISTDGRSFEFFHATRDRIVTGENSIDEAGAWALIQQVREGVA